MPSTFSKPYRPCCFLNWTLGRHGCASISSVPYINDDKDAEYTCYFCTLTHWDWVTHTCGRHTKLVQITACRLTCAKPLSEPMLEYCQFGISNKLRWNQNSVNRNIYIFNQENTFENIVWNMAVILSQPQCVYQDKWLSLGVYIWSKRAADVLMQMHSCVLAISSYMGYKTKHTYVIMWFRQWSLSRFHARVTYHMEIKMTLFRIKKISTSFWQKLRCDSRRITISMAQCIHAYAFDSYVLIQSATDFKTKFCCTQLSNFKG